MTTFMFWNLHEAAHGLRCGDETQWRQQVAQVQRHRPDVLAVTEGWDWHLDDEALFRRALTDFGYQHGELYEAKTRCDMAVMWNDPITCRLVERQPHREAWWHGHLRVTLDLPDQERPLVLMVSHLNPVDPTLRTIEGSWLRNRMQHTDHGVLVMDANTAPPGDVEPEPHPSRNPVGSPTCDRRALAALSECGLVDVGASFGDRRPTHGYFDLGPQTPAAPIRLDQAWATPSVRLVDYDVVDDHPDSDGASDHRAIRFTIA